MPYHTLPTEKQILTFLDGNKNTALQEFMWMNGMLGSNPFNARRAFLDGFYHLGLLTKEETLGELAGW